MPEISSRYFELHVIRKSDMKCLLLKRSEVSDLYPGIWQMITGKVEDNETTKNAVIRELHEETGLKAVKIYSIHKVNVFYFAPSDLLCMSPVFFCYAADGEVRISAEHSEFRWADFREAGEIIHWPNQTESLRIIGKYLGDKKLFSKLTEL